MSDLEEDRGPTQSPGLETDAATVLRAIYDQCGTTEGQMVPYVHWNNKQLGAAQAREGGRLMRLAIDFKKCADTRGGALRPEHCVLVEMRDKTCRLIIQSTIAKKATELQHLHPPAIKDENYRMGDIYHHLIIVGRLQYKRVVNSTGSNPLERVDINVVKKEKEHFFSPPTSDKNSSIMHFINMAKATHDQVVSEKEKWLMLLMLRPEFANPDRPGHVNAEGEFQYDMTYYDMQKNILDFVQHNVAQVGAAAAAVSGGSRPKRSKVRRMRQPRRTRSKRTSWQGTRRRTQRRGR